MHNEFDQEQEVGREPRVLPWDRLPKEGDRPAESAPAYRAFLDYCEMGAGRSIRKLHAEYVKAAPAPEEGENGVSAPKDRPQSARKAPAEKTKVPTLRLETLFDWSERFRWVERAAEYGVWIRREHAIQHQKEAERMAERQAKLAMAFQEKVVRRLSRMTDEDLMQMSFRDLIRWFDVAVKIERLARGEATENIHQEMDGVIGIEVVRPPEEEDG